MLVIAVTLAFAAEPDITYDGAAFVPKTAYGMMMPEKPGMLQILFADDAAKSCDPKDLDKLKDSRKLLIGFAAITPGATTTEVWAMKKGGFAEPDWKGQVTLTAMPTVKGGGGTATFALDGKKDHATGAVPFTLCTDLVPYVPPSSAFTVQKVQLVDIFMDDRRTLDVKMPFPSEWKVDENPMGVRYIAQDGVTNLEISFADATSAQDFRSWADSQIAAFKGDSTHVTEVSRTTVDGVSTLRWIAGFNGQADMEHVDVFVQPEGLDQQIHCSASGPVGLSIYDEIANACGQITTQ